MVVGPVGRSRVPVWAGAPGQACGPLVSCVCVASASNRLQFLGALQPCRARPASRQRRATPSGVAMSELVGRNGRRIWLGHGLLATECRGRESGRRTSG